MTVDFKGNKMANSLHDGSYQQRHRMSLLCQLSSFLFQNSSKKPKNDLIVANIVVVSYFNAGVGVVKPVKDHHVLTVHSFPTAGGVDGPFA